MSDYRRTQVSGGRYFFTLVSFHRQPILISPLARSCLRSALHETRELQPFRMDAICLLPDHLHCIWTLPDGDVDFSGRWNRIKGLFVKRYLAAGGASTMPNASRQRKGETALWQRRFWEHCLRDEADFRHHLDYLHFNPVKHGHVLRPGDWPWSSLRRYIRLGWYDAEWGAHEPESLRDMSGLGE
jgi:putative transposase